MDHYTKKLIVDTISDPIGVIYRAMEWLRKSPHEPMEDVARIMRNGVLLMSGRDAETYREEIEFVRNQPLDFLSHCAFPYPMIKDPVNVEDGYDEELKLPFVLHNGSRLYFPRHYMRDRILRLYHGYLERECLLGFGCVTKMPHAYVTSGHCVEAGDVLLDIGCAEALFTLHNIDVVSKAYMFEGEQEWLRPLKATFAHPSMSSKVNIINRFVGLGGVNPIDLIDANDAAHYFIKMDIEGAERSVLQSIREFLTTRKVKLSCCLYHRQDDADFIVPFLEDCGYVVKLSDGYMLPKVGGADYPFFRRGMAYARNF